MMNIMNSNSNLKHVIIAQDMYRTGKVDLHLHSTFSDGHNTPEDIIKHAILRKYMEIAIVDHVRKTTVWLDKFAFEIERLKRIYRDRITLYSGIEAKVINLKGDIDAKPEFFTTVDLVLGAFHRIPKGEDQYFSEDEINANRDRALEYWFTGFMKLLENNNVHIIAHPTAILKRHNIVVPSDMKSIIARKAAYWGKTLEVNSKYQVPDEEFLSILHANKVKLSFGSDSHSIEEM
jgi:HisJ family histidinol phosphate phosphatase